MNVLVFNCGSSSLKYRLIAMPGETQLSGGEAQRIGPPTAKPSCLVLHREGQPPESRVIPMHDHAEALQQVVAVLQETGVMPDVIGHRFVNGGPNVTDHSYVNDAVLAELIAHQDLAPIHNPPAIATIQACRTMFPGLPQVVISDTAYHRTIPLHARTYALPAAVRQDMGIRKYGYHGISHQYVVTETSRLMSIPLDRFHAVSCHLGSGGASLCAVAGGQSIDNTMGYSPLQGLVMSTRCGDLDPGFTLQLLAHAVGDRDAVEGRLNKKSGVLGLSGRSADIRDALDSTGDDSQNGRDRMTTQVYLWRLKKYLGAYMTLVGRPHAVIFTDTIGETVPQVRETVCSAMDAFGIRIDPGRNASNAPLPLDVATLDSPVRVWAVATNEEISIARSVYQVACKS